MGRKAPRKRLVRRVMACPTGASQAPERFSALRPPLDSGWRSKVAKPGRGRAPRERDGLFDIVKWELPKTVRRRAASSAVLILRSAHALAVPQSRKGVRASRRMRTVALMLRDASQRIWALEAPALAFGCDAPQHEGDGARRILAKRSHVEEPTCGCGKRSLVRLACFRPVIYREPRNFNVLSRKRA